MVALLLLAAAGLLRRCRQPARSAASSPAALPQVLLQPPLPLSAGRWALKRQAPARRWRPNNSKKWEGKAWALCTVAAGGPPPAA